METIFNIPQINVSYSRVRDNSRIITSSQDAYEVFRDCFNPETVCLYEEFYALFLDRAGQIIGVRLVNRGTATCTPVNSKLIFAIALSCNATSIVLAHNHPSGNLKPSQEDIRLTNRLVEFGKLIDTQILDHLILSDGSYFSFSDDGKI